MNNDDVTVVTKCDMPPLKMGKRLSECYLGKGNDHRNKKYASIESLDNNFGVVWKWKSCYSTEIS